MDTIGPEADIIEKDWKSDHQVTAKWSPSCHQVVTNWSPGVTGGLPSGHQVVTKKWIFRSARTSCTTFDWPARPCARISSPPSSPSPFPSSPCDPAVTPSPQVVVVVDHPEGPASCKWSSMISSYYIKNQPKMAKTKIWTKMCSKHIGPEDPSNRQKIPKIFLKPNFRKLQDDSKNVSL